VGFVKMKDNITERVDKKARVHKVENLSQIRVFKIGF